jgi:hypothetical protein
MSNDATSMYSTWFSTASTGYCERNFVLVLAALGLSPTDSRDEACDKEAVSTSSGSKASRSTGGCGERALRSLRTEMAEGERDEGKEEKEGWRWSEVVCWFCDAGGRGFDEEGGGGLWEATCIAAKAIVFILSASPATPAS